MMYIPDKWVLLEISNETESIQKIFAGWVGGFGGSDSWKLSSGIVKVVKHDTYYEFHNHSGSIYKCNKNSIGMTGYMTSIYSNLKNNFGENTSLKILDSVDQELKIPYNI